MDRTNSELARGVLDLILAYDRRMPTSPQDPMLDEAAALIDQGLKREGFVFELFRQASAAGIAIEARELAALLIAALRNRAKSG